MDNKENRPDRIIETNEVINDLFNDTNNKLTNTNRYKDSTWANGDIAIRAGGISTRLPKGSTGQILTMEKGVPTWKENSAPSRIIGQIIDYSGTEAAEHTLICNGETIGKVGSGADNESASYETIFNILKNSWGNAGTESFNNGDTVLLPDLRGMFTRGTGTHGTITSLSGDAVSGSDVGVNQLDQSNHIKDLNTISGNVGSTYTITPNEAGSYTPTMYNTYDSGNKDGMRVRLMGRETRPVSYGVTKCVIYE